VSKRYYRAVDKRTSRAYEIGRDFEYRIMAALRRLGWHCMRRFGSQGVVFCANCKRHVSRRTLKCSNCKTDKHVLRASLDITAFKNGVYLMITCKYSENKTTIYLDDEYWENLVVYAAFYDAIPIFAGCKQPENKVYFVDLRKKVNYTELLVTYRYKSWVRPEEKHVKRLLKEAWSVIDQANIIIGNMHVTCPKCKHKFKIPNVTDLTEKKKARWTEIKVKQINIINKLLWRSGAWATAEDDLAKIFEKASEILATEQEGDKK